MCASVHVCACNERKCEVKNLFFSLSMNSSISSKLEGKRCVSFEWRISFPFLPPSLLLPILLLPLISDFIQPLHSIISDLNTLDSLTHPPFSFKPLTHTHAHTLSLTHPHSLPHSHSHPNTLTPIHIPTYPPPSDTRSGMMTSAAVRTKRRRRGRDGGQHSRPFLH